MRRVLGLSAETAFWFVFTLPWLLLGGVSVIGYVQTWLPDAVSFDVQSQALEFADGFINDEVMATYVEPLVNEIFELGGAGLPIASFLVALWSGSRSIQTFVEANMIINGQFRERGFFLVRLQSALLLVGMATALSLTLALLAAVPRILGRIYGLPVWLVTLVWLGVLLLLTVGILTGLMHITMHQRPSLFSSLPGAVLTVAGWWGGSWLLSIYLERVFADTSIYGVLAAPIAIMLYSLGLALVAYFGVAVNAALRGVSAGSSLEAPSAVPMAKTQPY